MPFWQPSEILILIFDALKSHKILNIAPSDLDLSYPHYMYTWMCKKALGPETVGAGEKNCRWEEGISNV